MLKHQNHAYEIIINCIMDRISRKCNNLIKSMYLILTKSVLSLKRLL